MTEGLYYYGGTAACNPPFNVLRGVRCINRRAAVTVRA